MEVNISSMNFRLKWRLVLWDKHENPTTYCWRGRLAFFLSQWYNFHFIVPQVQSPSHWYPDPGQQSDVREEKVTARWAQIRSLCKRWQLHVCRPSEDKIGSPHLHEVNLPACWKFHKADQVSYNLLLIIYFTSTSLLRASVKDGVSYGVWGSGRGDGGCSQLQFLSTLLSRTSPDRISQGR